MSGDIEWGPWIEHDGKGCPCVGQMTMTEREFPVSRWLGGPAIINGRFVTYRPRPQVKGSWHWSPGFTRIIRYRIRRPSALQTLIEIAANPAPLPEEVDA